ncbi:MAG TPA: deoxynucleoside kinase [Terriglobales bacterium]|nr:deoxynucleoside kinase [Terriglobales bacterium]
MPQLFEPPRYIAIEGPIRVGKSTLAGILAEQMNARRVLEPEANPYLASFYRGEGGSAFRLQMYFLIERYRQLRALGPTRPLDPVVADYIFEKDKIFAYLNLSDEELAIYREYFAQFRREIAAPDLVIYLKATPEVLRKRVARKNLKAEQQLSDEYLEEVVKAYDHFFFHYTQSDLLVIDTSEIDFVERNRDLQELLRRLAEPIRGTQYFLPLGS